MIQPSHQLPEPRDAHPGEDPVELALKEPVVGAAGPRRHNALKVVHGLLRGRYHWVALLGVILGGLGGYWGYQYGSKTFASTGAVRINFQLLPIMGPNPDSNLPSADAFVQDQIAAMTSWKVMAKAVLNPEWLALRPMEAGGAQNQAVMTPRVQDLLRRLKVSQKNDQVQVESRDRDPAVAVAGAHAVIDAYRAVYIDHDDEKYPDPRMEVLDHRQKDLTTQLNALQKQVRQIADKYGSEQLDAQYIAKLQQVDRIEATIQDVQNSIAVAMVDRKGLPDDDKSPLADLSDEGLAIVDPGLATLFEKLNEAKLRLAIAQTQSNQQAVHDAELTIKSLQDQIDARKSNLLRAANIGITFPGVPQIRTKQDLAAAEAKLDALQKPHADLLQQLVDIGTDNLNMTRLNSQAQEIGQKLDAVNQRIEQLQLENPTTRRVEVVTPGDWPVAADRDTRPRNAALGGLGGTALAALAVMAAGLISGRLKAPRDLELNAEDRAVLGLIPQLDQGPHYPRLAAQAAEYMHRSRNLLEIWGRGNRNLVLGVTSPSPGSGNTSVAMSLGVSFATAGLRTLLIDCDFMTNGLTPRLQTVVTRDLGRVLVRLGLVTPAQLREAQPPAAGAAEAAGPARDRALGAACVRLGFITPAELERALAVQAHEPVGVLDALNGDPLEACVGKTGIGNLSILPRGKVSPAHAAKLSSHTLRGVLETARQRYDTVIIDTSAILSSLEASIVASSVDGMVLTVARGERRRRLSAALERLDTLQCPVAGIIFNHVLPGDMPPHTDVSRLSTANTYTKAGEEEIRVANLELIGRLATLGPLASSIVSRSPQSEETKSLE